MTTNLINGMKYIGRDLYNNKSYLGGGKIIRMAIKKYGRENFSKEILRYCNTFHDLVEGEKYFIDLYNAPFSKEFYNISDSSTIGGTAHMIPVYQYDLSGKLIMGYKSIKSAAGHFGIRPENVRQAIKRNGFCCEYYWLYEKHDMVIVPSIKFKTQAHVSDRVVFMYDLNGKFVKSFKNAVYAAKELGITKANIYQALCGRLKTASGYHWLYDEYDVIPENILIKLSGVHPFPIKVSQFTLEGNHIADYDSILKASELSGVNRQTLTRALNGRKSKGNYLWVYTN